MSALAQPTRLSTFGLLSRAGSDGMTAGDLASKTGTRANTMSAHLLILTQAGLTSSRRAGRNIFYTVVPNAVLHLLSFLVDECHDGKGELFARFKQELSSCLSDGV